MHTHKIIMKSTKVQTLWWCAGMWGVRLALLCRWGHGNSVIIVVDDMAHLVVTTSDDHCCVCYPLVTSLAPPTLWMLTQGLLLPCQHNVIVTNLVLLISVNPLHNKYMCMLCVLWQV